MKREFSKGVVLAATAAFISGVAVFINKFGVSLWNDSSVYTTAKNIVAALFLTGLLTLLGRISELKKLSKGQWLKLVLIGSVGGSVPFLLFFKSLTMISAPEAAFLHKTLFLWVALLSYPFLKERLSIVQFVALGALLFSVFLFDAPSKWNLGFGSLLAILATMLWAVENIIAKIVLKDVSALTVGWARMFFGSVFLLIYLAFTGNIVGIVPDSAGQIGWTILTGAVLFGYVATWYSALKIAPATIVSSVLVIAAPITAILSGIFVSHTFPAKAALQIIIIAASLLVLTKQLGGLYSKLIRKRAEAY